MAYVPGFQFDIFISYARTDNLPFDDVNWVERFHSCLEVALWRREGRHQIAIWRDPLLDGSQIFNETLATKLSQSALLLCLNSPSYANSEYCEKERAWFCSANGKRLALGDRSRVAQVLLYDMPREKWPAEFGGKAGFKFFEGSRPGRLGDPVSVRSAEFSEGIRDLADALFETLEAMKAAAGQEQTAKAATAPRLAAQKVFVAKVSDALDQKRRRLIAELKQDGYDVLDGVPPPFENSEHDKTVEQLIGQADLTVHLLDHFPGLQLPGESKGYIQRQAEIGRSSKTPQIIWVQKDTSPGSNEVEEPDEAYRTFVNQLETGKRGTDNYEFVRGMASDLPGLIREHLQARKTAPPPVASLQTSVLLDVHYKDHPQVTELYRYLADRGIQPLLMPEFDDPKLSEGLFVEQLKRVTGMIVVFGQVAAEWVLERLFAAVKEKTKARSPVRAFGIYVAPPHKELPASWTPLQVYPMDNMKGFDPKSLGPLLTEITGSPKV